MKAPRHFTADPIKNARNLTERGINLIDGATVFDFGTAISAADDRKDYGEIRKSRSALSARAFMSSSLRCVTGFAT